MYFAQIGTGDSIFSRAVLVSILCFSGFSRIFLAVLTIFCVFFRIWMGKPFLCR